MADDIAPAIVQAAALMSGMTIASIRAKGAGFMMPDGRWELWDAYRVVGAEPKKSHPFYYVEDAINYLLGEGYRLLPPSDLDSWTRTLNSGRELTEHTGDRDGNICVAVFGREAVAQIAANMEAEGRGTTSNNPTAQLTASILAASARYNLQGPYDAGPSSPPVPQKHLAVVSLSRLAAIDLNASTYWSVRGLGNCPDSNSYLAEMKFDSLEDAFNHCVIEGCIPMDKSQEERWKAIVNTAREFVGMDPADDNWPYFVSGDVLNVFLRHV